MQKTIVTLTDDLDPSGETKADETVSFGLDGKFYEIDLAHANADKLRARLKEFIQAGRPAKGARRTARPAIAPVTPAATESRHQNGSDPAAIRAWAIKEGVTLPKRGRLPSKVGAAYRAAQFSNRGPLEELLREQRGENTPAPARAASTPAKATPAPAPAKTTSGEPEDPTDVIDFDFTPQPEPEADLAPVVSLVPEPKPEPAPALKDPVTEFAKAAAENDTATDDPNEAEAKKHYKPLIQLSPDAQKKKWERRTAHGCQRTNKVEEMTYMERVNAIANGASDRNLTILGMLAGIIPLKNDKVPYLNGSAQRLENLEMIQYAPASDDGWEITPFGEWAHKYHTVGA